MTRIGRALMEFWEEAAAVWCGLSPTIRGVLLAVVSLALAQQINRAIDRLAYHPRGRDPWLPAPDGFPPRTWADRLPLVGWWRLRRETPHHGSLFWMRPLLIELLFPAGIVGLYFFEAQGGLYPQSGPVAGAATLHAQFLLHFVLIALMTVATFIDFDEQTIPDEVTLIGAAIGVALVSLLPWSLLPTIVRLGFVPYPFHMVLTTSSHDPGWKDGLGGPQSWPPWCDTNAAFALAILAIAAWWLAVLPKIWTMRRGVARAFLYAAASVRRYRTWRLPSLTAGVMILLVGLAFARGGPYWQSAFSAVMGMVIAGGFTWAVRLVASRALGMEALGFGDVTLMAMLGAFLGWQTGLLIFGLAPMTALVIAVAQWIATRRHDIAFGPYLCLAAVVWLVVWRRWWHEWAVNAFAMGWVLIAVLIVSIVLLGLLLWVWQVIKSLLA
ncbi:MAG TPA: prepilin peptidase [Planctomycetaceae bacterium]|nr:prepilin peptidase [Planctomycetaceae bacterium]